MNVGTFICSTAVCAQYCDLAAVSPTVLVGIYFREPAPGKVGRSEIFDLRTGFAKTNPPSKTSISCGLQGSVFVKQFFHECTRINTNGLIRGKSLSWERSAVGSEIRGRRDYSTDEHGFTRMEDVRDLAPPSPPQLPVSQSLAQHSQLTTGN